MKFYDLSVQKRRRVEGDVSRDVTCRHRYTKNHAKIALSTAYQEEKHLAAQPVRPLVEASMDCHGLH